MLSLAAVKKVIGGLLTLFLVLAAFAVAMLALERFGHAWQYILVLPLGLWIAYPAIAIRRQLQLRGWD